MRLPEKKRLKLARRRNDYEKMIAKPGDYKGYKKPGSLNK